VGVKAAKQTQTGWSTGSNWCNLRSGSPAVFDTDCETRAGNGKTTLTNAPRQPNVPERGETKLRLKKPAISCGKVLKIKYALIYALILMDQMANLTISQSFSIVW